MICATKRMRVRHNWGAHTRSLQATQKIRRNETSRGDKSWDINVEANKKAIYAKTIKLMTVTQFLLFNK